MDEFNDDAAYTEDYPGDDDYTDDSDDGGDWD